MVFQNFNLFPHLSILENCILGPTWVRKLPRAEAEAKAMALLERVKIPDQANKRPGQLSGGQQQRVAIARSEEHTSELQSLMRISYAVFCLKKKKTTTNTNAHDVTQLRIET